MIKTFGFKLLKRKVCLYMHGGQAMDLIEPADGDIHIFRIKLDPYPASFCLFCCEESRSATQKGIKNNIANGSAIENDICNQLRGL